MAKNLIDGENIIVEEDGNYINLNLSSTYTNNLEYNITDSFKNNNVYSTTETVIGKWTNNKPIYRKVVDLGYLPNNTQTTVSLNISHLNKITHFEGLADAGGTLTTGGELIRPMISFTSIAMGDSISCYVSVSDNVATLVINTKADFSVYKGFLIIEYTKITD